MARKLELGSLVTQTLKQVAASSPAAVFKDAVWRVARSPAGANSFRPASAQAPVIVATNGTNTTQSKLVTPGAPAHPHSTGIGVVLQKRAGGDVVIVQVAPGGPAAQTKLVEAGDVIESVDMVTVTAAELPHVLRLILGPPGSVVNMLASSTPSPAILPASLPLKLHTSHTLTREQVTLGLRRGASRRFRASFQRSVAAVAPGADHSDDAPSAQPQESSSRNAQAARAGDEKMDPECVLPLLTPSHEPELRPLRTATDASALYAVENNRQEEAVAGQAACEQGETARTNASEGERKGEQAARAALVACEVDHGGELEPSQELGPLLAPRESDSAIANRQEHKAMMEVPVQIADARAQTHTHHTHLESTHTHHTHLERVCV